MPYIKPELHTSKSLDFAFKMMSSATGVAVEGCKQCSNCHHCN